MTLALGTVPAGTTLYIPFSSYAGSTGASVTLTGLAVTDIEIFKDGSTTQRASDAGYALLDTDGIDFDGITGIHGFSIDLSDNTDSGFFAVGSQYWVVVSAVTVDSQTVNFIAAVFRIGPAESVAGYPKVDVSHYGGSAGTFSGGRPEVNTTHAAGTAWNSGAIGASTLAADTITDAKVASDVTIASVTGAVGSVTGAVGSVTGNVGGNVVGSVASVTAMVTANVTQISGDSVAADNLEAALDGTGGVTITAALTGNITGDLSGSVGSVTGAVGSVAGNVGGNVSGSVGSVTGNVGGNVTGSVGSVATGGITRASFAADTGLQTVRSNTAQAGGATTITLDASASATDDIYNNHIVYLTGGTGAGQARFVTDYNGTTKVATVSTWTTNPDNTSTFALIPFDAIPGASAPTAAQVADAVWDELLSGHAVSGSAGEALSAAGTAGDPWLTELPGAYGAGTAGKIIGDNLNATVSSRATQTSVDTIDDFLDTEIAAIKAKTDNLPADPADASDIAASFTTVNGKLDTIDDFLDTEVAAIKAKTDSLTFTVAGVVDANVTDWKGSTAPAMTGDAFARLGAPAGASVSADVAAVKADTAAVKLKTDNLPASPAATGDIPTATQNADALLNRDMSAVSVTNSRSPINALRFLRNKWSLSGTTLTVTGEDDTTTAWTAVVTTNASADPITGSDPT